MATGEKRHADFETVWDCPGLRALGRELWSCLAPRHDCR
jgi:hypothetical protein